MPGEIRFCTNEGSIRGSYSAGIAAKIAASGEYGALIESCSNSGNIDGDTAGGICSNYYKESSADLKLEILSCTNEGSIRPRNTESQAYCSGILASASVSGQGEIFLQSCENIGDVIAEEGVCGGILAKYVPFTVNNDPVTISLEDCRNAAEIKGGSMGVGGIVGSVTSLKDGSRILLRIDSSENTGIIRTNGCYVRMGGLVGVLNSCSAGMEIKNSTNSGELIPDEEDVSHDLIPVNDVIGGIIGLVGDDGPDPTIDADNRMAYAPDLIIENCINNGELHQNEDGRIYHLGDMIGYTVVDVDIK